MKILVVYYSRTNTTKKVAKELVALTNASMESLRDEKKRQGIIGYLSAGRAAAKKELAKIGSLEHDPAGFDLVVIASPVWVGTMASAIRTYVTENKDKFNKVAFLSTQGSSKEQKIFGDLKELTSQEPVAEVFFTTKEVVKGSHKAKLDEFAAKIIK